MEKITNESLGAVYTHTGSLKENKKKNIKGITLVALIVTIIILMILAGVVIATVTGNNGILNKSKLARDTYQNSASNENSILSDYENEIDKATFDIASSRNSELFYGKNSKIYKIRKNIFEDETEGYIPILSSNNSSELGIASSNFGTAWQAFKGITDTNIGYIGCYYENEDIPNGYVMFETKGIQISIKRFKARIGVIGKAYDIYLEYYDNENNTWTTVYNTTMKDTWTKPKEIEYTLDNSVFTTAVRIYTTTTKTYRNNLKVINFQVYPQ